MAHGKYEKMNVTRSRFHCIFKFPIISGGKSMVETRTLVVGVTLVHHTLGPKNYTSQHEFAVK
jgi:hypothetical protein